MLTFRMCPRKQVHYYHDYYLLLLAAGNTGIIVTIFKEAVFFFFKVGVCSLKQSVLPAEGAIRTCNSRVNPFESI